MGYNIRGKRDGSGPHKDSFRRTDEGKTIGRRGAVCKEPPTPKKKP